jgi:hypothetical protein
MTHKKLLLGVTVLAGLLGAGYLCTSSSREADAGPGVQMTEAADKFLTSLTADQKKQAVFAFDDKERFNWDFVPLQDKDKKPTRKGLRMEEMTADQKEAARALVKAGTSKSGFTKATTIMSLEAILNDLEKGKGPVRNPDWYFFTVFGAPSKAEKWGWRVEGHHLSLNFVIDKGKIVASTPAFFGCNPADTSQVVKGDAKGKRILSEAEDGAKELFAALDDDQRKVAFQEKQFPEVKMKTTAPQAGDPVGLAAAKMNDKQKDLLWKLLKGYAERMPAEVAEVELGRVKDAGLDKVYFAFAREDAKPGKPYTYRVQGPTFVIEFLNVQPDSAGNPANHIHSVWRNLKADFGLDGK